jgi:hypothetical protein
MPPALSLAAVVASVQIVIALFVLVAITTRLELMSLPSAVVTCLDSLELTIESVAYLLLI